MRSFLKNLLPTKDEAKKLRLEAWKTLIVVGVIPLFAAILGFSIPKTREWIVSGLSQAWTWVGSGHEVWGWVIFLLLGLAIYSLRVIVQKIRDSRAPAHTKLFLVGEYNDMLWRWRWKGCGVDVAQMHGYCLKCDTELIIKSQTAANDRKDVGIFCTTCNNSWRISNVEDLKDHIRRKIERDARSGSWSAQPQATEKNPVPATPHQLSPSRPPAGLEELEFRILQLAYENYPEQYTSEEYEEKLDAPVPDVGHALRKLQRLKYLYKSDIKQLWYEGQPNPDGYTLLDSGIELVKQDKQKETKHSNG